MLWNAPDNPRAIYTTLCKALHAWLVCRWAGNSTIFSLFAPPDFCETGTHTGRSRTAPGRLMRLKTPMTFSSSHKKPQEKVPNLATLLLRCQLLGC